MIFGSAQSIQFALEGDSGSLVVDESLAAVGLRFAVTEAVNISFASPIQPILKHFTITID